MPEHTYIGTRNTVVWNCYREPWDTDDTYQRRVEQMREAFVAMGRRAGR